MATQRPILISGAGLASLLLARRLRHAQIPVIIFERDADMSSRGQGYRLRLSDHGLDAIESVLASPGAQPPDAWDIFWARCGKTGGAGFAAVDAATGETTTSHPSVAREPLGSRGGKIIGIARRDMREVFMQGLEDAVQWGRHVSGYELVGGDGGGGGVRAVFADGSRSVEGAMLIGGEGIKSEVARQLSAGRLKVYDTGARGIHGQAPTSAFRALGEGVFRLVDETRGADKKVFAITNVRPGDMDDPTVKLGWTMGGSPGVIKAPGDDYAVVGKPAADIAKELTSEWHERVKPLFDEMDEAEAAFWKITCSAPWGVPEWDNEPRVTLIGDAVHSMTPAGGIGANTAVRDSALLGRLIAEAGGFKDGVTSAYEKEMRVYASEAVAESYNNAASQFGVKIDESTPTVR